jgi:hypothetical protein
MAELRLVARAKYNDAFARRLRRRFVRLLVDRPLLDL